MYAMTNFLRSVPAPRNNGAAWLANTVCVAVGMSAMALTGCRPSDVLNVPAPLGVEANVATSLSGAESLFNGEEGDLFQAIGSNLLSSTLQLTDEFHYAQVVGYGPGGNIDARITEAIVVDGQTFYEAGDSPLQSILGARTALLVAAAALEKFEPAAGQSKVGEAFALVGYAELFMAEDYCAGVPLSDAAAGGGYQFGRPLTTDSLLDTAEAHFDSALAHSAGNDTIQSLASVGLARALLDQGQFVAADTAVANVSTSFVYSIETAPHAVTNAGPTNVYGNIVYGYCAGINMSDREGQNGLNFISAQDPRLNVDSTLSAVYYAGPMLTCDGKFNGVSPATVYYPSKFGSDPAFIPLATGVEARLIEAEAALQANQTGAWATDLNTLRANAAGTYLQAATAMAALTPDSTTGAASSEQVDVMFRERAFWLFGTGTRLGDLRRLIRQYHRTPATVFPTGVYAGGVASAIPTYGTDVSLTLPTTQSGTSVANPNYKGCLTSAGTA